VNHFYDKGVDMGSASIPTSRGADPAVVAAVSEVLVRYATGIDRRDWDLFRTCFTDDCKADYGTMPDGAALLWSSAEEITAWMAASHRDMGHTLHRITNPRVEGDGDSVTARCYVDALLMTPDGHTIMNAVGFYDDTLVLTADGWKISQRQFTAVRMQAG
jgi:3-phenylpropionate/cinnamic acid dioxygenase small subunit